MTSVCKLVETSILKWDLNRLRNTCVCGGGEGGRSTSSRGSVWSGKLHLRKQSVTYNHYLHQPSRDWWGWGEMRGWRWK